LIGIGHRVRRQTTEDRWFKVLNIEQQKKKLQNDEVITSIFEISCSIFCGSKKATVQMKRILIAFLLNFGF